MEEEIEEIIEFYLQDCELKLPNKEQIINWIKDSVEFESRELGAISIIFCSDDYLLDINRQYLSHDYYTDIITFDYTEEEEDKTIVSGDLFISIDTVARNAFQYRARFKEELHRVIIHGVLHLLGYKDKTPNESVEMRSKENFYLARLESISVK